MAPKFVCLFLILGLVLPATLADLTEILPTGNKIYTVCEDLGWARGVDIVGWLLPKVVRVGDSFKFIFKEPQTVAVVDAIGYSLCTLSGLIVNDKSGEFIYKFTKPGIYYFVSAGPGDCTYDITKPLKMLVTVLL